MPLWITVCIIKHFLNFCCFILKRNSSNIRWESTCFRSTWRTLQTTECTSIYIYSSSLHADCVSARGLWRSFCQSVNSIQPHVIQRISKQWVIITFLKIWLKFKNRLWTHNPSSCFDFYLQRIMNDLERGWFRNTARLFSGKHAEDWNPTSYFWCHITS